MLNSIRAEILFFRGQNKAKHGNLENSINYFDRALSLKPNSSGIYLHKAVSLSKQNKYSEALGIIKKAISLKPDRHANYLFQGMIHYDSGEYDNALINFEKSLSLSPENPLLKCYIALTLLRKDKKVKEAYDTLSKDIQNTNPEFKARFLVFCESFLLKHKNKSMSLDDSVFHESYLKEKNFLSKFLNKLFYKPNQIYVLIFYVFRPNKRKYHLHYLNAEQRLIEGDIIKSIKEYKKALNYFCEFNDAFAELLEIYFYKNDYWKEKDTSESGSRSLDGNFLFNCYYNSNRRYIFQFVAEVNMLLVLA